MEGMLLGCLAHQTGINGPPDVLHYDFSDPAAVFRDNNYSLPCTNNSLLGSVYDRSSQKNHAKLGSDANGAGITWKQGVFGKATLGAWQSVAASGLIYFALNNPTCFSVCQGYGFTLAVVYSYQKTGTGITMPGALLVKDATAPILRRSLIWREQTGVIDHIGLGSTVNSGVLTVTPNIIPALNNGQSSPAVYIITGGPNQGVQIYVNNTRLNFLSVYNDSPTMTMTYTLGQLLVSGFAANFFGGIGEIRIYRGWRSASDCRELTLELRTKFGF